MEISDKNFKAAILKMLQKIISNDLQTKSIKSKQRKGWKKKNEIKKVTELIYFYFRYKKNHRKIK